MQVRQVPSCLRVEGDKGANVMTEQGREGPLTTWYHWHKRPSVMDWAEQGLEPMIPGDEQSRPSGDGARPVGVVLTHDGRMGRRFQERRISVRTMQSVFTNAHCTALRNGRCSLEHGTQ